MTTKEWLGQYRLAKIAAEKCFQDLDAASVVLRSPALTGIPRGGGDRDLSDIVAMQDRIREKTIDRPLKSLSVLEAIICA